MAARLYQWRRPAGRRVGIRPHRPVSLYRPLRRHHNKGRVVGIDQYFLEARFALPSGQGSDKRAERTERYMGYSGNRHGKRESGLNQSGVTRRETLALAALGLIAMAPGAARAGRRDEQLTWGVHISLAPTWFDPAETPGIITPFMVLYALHDAMVKPMPGQPLAPSLAESWFLSDDGLTYEFVLRKGAKFHNGDPVTAEDVKFSFERYRGTARDLMKNRVAAIETPDSRHLHFKLKEPWPDFLTFYGSASGAGWIVPKAYVE